MLQTGRSPVRFPMKSLNCNSVYLMFPAAQGPGVYSASNRNECMKTIFVWLLTPFSLV
jgi:hypothetical protein